MKTLIASLIFAAACSTPSKFQSTVAPPGPPPPAGDSYITVKVPPNSLIVTQDVIRLKPGITINFATDSDTILPESQRVLDEVATVMTENMRIKIRVEGHTDNTGGVDHNQDLSTRRSASVKAYLQTKGIDDVRLDSIGCGEAVPMATNATEDGRLQNRRVEFVVVRHNHPRGNCELYGANTAMK